MHVHISPVEFLTTAAMVIIFGFFWRSISFRYAETRVGQAMAFIY